LTDRVDMHRLAPLKDHVGSRLQRPFRLHQPLNAGNIHISPYRASTCRAVSARRAYAYGPHGERFIGGSWWRTGFELASTADEVMHIVLLPARSHLL
jgi:hypothetical protein